MTSLRGLITGLAIAGLLASAPGASAQQAPAVVVEATLGAGVLSGGQFIDGGWPAADLTVGVRLRDTGAGTLVAALSAGISGSMGGDLYCAVAPDGGCLPRPLFLSGGLLLGLERRFASWASGRVMAGPAYYHAVEGSGVPGIQARLDAAIPVVARTAIVASLRTGMLPRYEGESLALTSFGLGLRIH